MNRFFMLLICCLPIGVTALAGCRWTDMNDNKPENIAVSEHKAASQEPETATKYKSVVIGQDTTVYIHAEVMPEFPGGARELLRYLARSTRYPRVGHYDVEGHVVVRFVVFADCSVGNAEIVKSVDRNLDEDALRVVREMPKWESPGMMEGKPVNVFYLVPVQYKLEY